MCYSNETMSLSHLRIALTQQVKGHSDDSSSSHKYTTVFWVVEFCLAISQLVVGVETWSIAHSDGKNLGNTWDTSMA